jgi:hypothetical protein
MYRNGNSDCETVKGNGWDQMTKFPDHWSERPIDPQDRAAKPFGRHRALKTAHVLQDERPGTSCFAARFALVELKVRAEAVSEADPGSSQAFVQVSAAS